MKSEAEQESQKSEEGPADREWNKKVEVLKLLARGVKMTTIAKQLCPVWL